MAGLVLSSPAPARAQQDLIQCPDWRSLVSPAVLRAASDPARSGDFDRKLQQARAAGSRDVSPLPAVAAGEGDDGGRRVTTAAACTYTIQSGDTLGSIAARHLGTSKRWPDLARANPGIDPNRLRVGTVINLPCTGGVGQGESPPKAKPGAPLAGTGFLARLSGQKTPAAASSGKKAGASPAAQGGAAAAGKKAGSGGGANGAGAKKTTAAQSGAKKTAKGASSGAAAKKAAAPSKPENPVPPPPPPLPVWTAKAGEDFAVVLNRWAKSAKYRVVVDSSDAWKLEVPVRIQAKFEDAVSNLVRGLGHGGQPPRVRIYPNRVIRLGGAL